MFDPETARIELDSLLTEREAQGPGTPEEQFLPHSETELVNQLLDSYPTTPLNQLKALVYQALDARTEVTFKLLAESGWAAEVYTRDGWQTFEARVYGPAGDDTWYRWFTDEDEAEGAAIQRLEASV